MSKLHFYPFEGSSFNAGEQGSNHFLDSLAPFTYDASQCNAECLITSFSTFSSYRFAVPQDCGSTYETGKSSDCFDSNDDWLRGRLRCQQRPRINKSRCRLHLFESKTALSTGEQSLHAQAQPYLLQLWPTEVLEEGEIAASLLTICRSCYMRKCWMQFLSTIEELEKDKVKCCSRVRCKLSSFYFYGNASVRWRWSWWRDVVRQIRAPWITLHLEKERWSEQQRTLDSASEIATHLRKCQALQTLLKQIPTAHGHRLMW